MPPCQAIANSEDSALRYAESMAQTDSRCTTIHDPAYIRLGQFTIPIVFATERFVLAVVMFLGSYIFQVVKTVIRGIAVLMVNLHAAIFWALERRHYDVMHTMPCRHIPLGQIDVWIGCDEFPAYSPLASMWPGRREDISRAGAVCSLDSPYPSKIGYFVPSFVSRNRLPVLWHRMSPLDIQSRPYASLCQGGF